MGDRKGKRKMPEYEESGKSSADSARGTRARTTAGPGGQSGAGGNPASLPPLQQRDESSRNRPGPQQRPAQTQDLISRLGLSASSATQHQASGGGGNPGTLLQINLARRQQPEPVISDFQPQGQGQGRGLLMPAPSSGEQRGGTSRDGARGRGGVGNPGGLRLAPQAGTPSSSSQMNFARNSGMSGAQLAATMVPQHRPQASSSSSQAQHSRIQQSNIRPLFPRTHISDYLPHGQGLSMPAPSGGAKRGNTSHGSARGRAVQVQERAPAPAGQPGTVTGASGSRQPRPWNYAGIGQQCPACHNDPRHNRCMLCGREPRLAINPRQHQPPPAPPQGFPAVRASNTTLIAMRPTLDGIFDPGNVKPRYHRPAVRTSHTILPPTLVGIFAPWNVKPRAPGLQVQAQSSAGPGQHHVQQVPEHFCPRCRSRSGLLQTHPWRHYCICIVCRVSHLVCPLCGGFVPTR